MTTYLTYRPRITADGLVLCKQLQPHQILEVLTNLRGQLPRLRPLAPDWAQAPLSEVEAEALEVLRLLVAEVGIPQTTPVQIPEELTQSLRELQRQDDLLDLRAVNHLLDYLIGKTGNLLQAYADNPEVDEYTAAARRVEALWFSQGRLFLRQSARRQWAETQRRFSSPSEATLKDLRLLRLHRMRERIMAFNDWFARLLGIDPDKPIPAELLEPEVPNAPEAPTQQELEARADALFNRLLTLAPSIWHRASDPQHVQARQLALGTLLEKLQERRSNT
jgi:hypothetical protein